MKPAPAERSNDYEVFEAYISFEPVDDDLDGGSWSPDYSGERHPSVPAHLRHPGSNPVRRLWNVERRRSAPAHKRSGFSRVEYAYRTPPELVNDLLETPQRRHKAVTVYSATVVSLALMIVLPIAGMLFGGRARLASEPASAASAKNETAGPGLSDTGFGGVAPGEEAIVPPSVRPSASPSSERVVSGFVMSSTSQADDDRIANLARAAEMLNGVEIGDGEEFSFLRAVGALSEDEGWRAAGSIAMRETEVVGAGVEQVASAVYAAGLQAGLTPVERQANRYEPDFCKPGLDAAVGEGAAPDGGVADLVLFNGTGARVRLDVAAEGQTVTVNVISYGLDDGVTRDVMSVSMGSAMLLAAQAYDDYDERGFSADDILTVYMYETRMVTRENGVPVAQEVVSEDRYLM